MLAIRDMESKAGLSHRVSPLLPRPTPKPQTAKALWQGNSKARCKGGKKRILGGEKSGWEEELS